MARKKLTAKKSIKRIKLKNDVKRIKLNEPEITIYGLFDLSAPLYYSGFALTDDYNIVLFFIDNEFIEKNNLTNNIIKFNLNENDLQIKFDNKTFLKPELLEDNDHFIFGDMGFIHRTKMDWINTNYPDCVFHPITKWFGKSVNTLIIILVEKFGRVVGVVKTYN
jgi:hypothetical protein